MTYCCGPEKVSCQITIAQKDNGIIEIKLLKSNAGQVNLVNDHITLLLCMCKNTMPIKVQTSSIIQLRTSTVK